MKAALWCGTGAAAPVTVGLRLAAALCSCLAPALVGAEGVKAALTLPPGLEQTLPLDPDGSHFWDAVRYADCPEDRDNPLGLCGNTLFGGHAMFVSVLSGDLRIRFQPPVGKIAAFEISHPGGLAGRDALMRAPIGFRFPVRGIRFGAHSAGIQGEFHIETGEITRLAYNLEPENSYWNAIRALNPRWQPGGLQFPGSLGTATGKFEQRADGLLDVTLYLSAFIPFGNSIGGDRVQMPAPYCAGAPCPGMEAPGSSIRPRLRLTTRRQPVEPCAPDCPEIPLNTNRMMTLHSYHSSFGDAFEVHIPQLGGDAVGRSHLQGRLHVQFGDRHGDFVPVSFWALVPQAILAEPPPTPLVGFTLNSLGHDEFLRFPNYTYQPTQVALANDPFDNPVGVLDLRSGRITGELFYRGLPAQDLLFTILGMNAGRIPTDTFRWRGPARFRRGPDGSTVFTFNSDVLLNFETFLFPDPTTSNPVRGWPAGPGAELNPFLNLRGSLAPAAAPAAVMQGSAENLLSSFGDRVSYRYSIPCGDAGGPFQFEFTNSANAARGGTFRLESLASATCTNSLRGAAGRYDTVNFTGFGTWSKDRFADSPHVVNVQISTAPGQEYWSIQIDGGLTSNANNKPPQDTQYVGRKYPLPPE